MSVRMAVGENMAYGNMWLKKLSFIIIIRISKLIWGETSKKFPLRWANPRGCC